MTNLNTNLNTNLKIAYNICILHAVLSIIIMFYALHKNYKRTFIMQSISLGISISNVELIKKFDKNKKYSKRSLILSIIHSILAIIMINVTLYKNKKDLTTIWAISLILSLTKIILIKNIKKYKNNFKDIK